MSVCSVEGCERPHEAMGYCGPHYKKWARTGSPLGKGRISPGVARDFLNDVVLNYEGDECLIWPYSKKTNGHGQINLSGRLVSVNIYVCDKVNGPKPSPEYETAHECGKGHEGCCAPKHLTWKTHYDNVQDKRKHGTHGRKLSEEQALMIKSLRGKRRRVELAAEYGVNLQTIKRIQLGNTWSHLSKQPWAAISSVS